MFKIILVLFIIAMLSVVVDAIGQTKYGVSKEDLKEDSDRFFKLGKKYIFLTFLFALVFVLVYFIFLPKSKLLFLALYMVIVVSSLFKMVVADSDRLKNYYRFSAVALLIIGIIGNFMLYKYMDMEFPGWEKNITPVIFERR